MQPGCCEEERESTGQGSGVGFLVHVYMSEHTRHDYQDFQTQQPRSGGPRLKESQAYPPAFGYRVSKLHLKQRESFLQLEPHTLGANSHVLNPSTLQALSCQEGRRQAHKEALAVARKKLEDGSLEVHYVFVSSWTD